MTRVIDARGLRCPWPAVRLARALREGDGSVEIVTDDPAAPAELAAVAQAAGAVLSAIGGADEGRFRVARPTRETKCLPDRPTA